MAKVTLPSYLCKPEQLFYSFCCNCLFKLIYICFFYHRDVNSKRDGQARATPRRNGLNAARRRSGILDLVGSFVSRQKNLKTGRRPVTTSFYSLSKPLVACIMFFLLEQKEPKIQDKPDPSGRFVGPSRTKA